MAKNVSLINYHASRATEELEKATSTSLGAARDSHMALSQLHLHHAGRLRGATEEAVR